MKRITALLLVALLSCSSSHSGVAARPLTLYDARRSVMAQLGPDGTITDGTARVVTHYDPSSRSMSLLGATLDVAQSVHVTGSRELDVHVGVLGPWHVRVLPSNEIEVDGHAFAHVEGIEASEAGMFRLGVLLCVVPVLSPSSPPPTDAALSPDADFRPPPPPPR